MRKKRLLAVIMLITVVPALLISMLAVFVFAYAKTNIDFRADEEMFIAAKYGNVTKLYYDVAGYKNENEYEPVEYASVSGATEKRSFVKYADISENIKNAFIAAEDREFFNHSGVNLRRTAFAALNYILNRSNNFGGSTITQQVIKNISGDNEKTIKRKLEEIIRAYNIEYSHSKEEIFEVYLNIVPMGEGIAGVSLASELYFGKTANELNFEEAALLAAITNAPTRYNPYNNYENALKKRNAVLFAMQECGYISEEEYLSAKFQPIALQERSKSKSNISSWFTETVCDIVARDLQMELGYTESAARMLVRLGGLKIYTTVDPQVQRKIEERLQYSEDFSEASYNGPQFSMVVFDSKTTDLRGVVGRAGKKEGNMMFNHALTPHTPGSTLKPLALYAPLINKREICWSSIFDDAPKDVYFNEDGTYRIYPKNSPNEYSGLITISDALAYSKNTVALELYKMLGKEKIFEGLYNDFNFKTLVEKEEKNGRVLTDLAESPLALGQLTYGVPLIDLVAAYSVFPSGGQVNKSRCYVKCYDGNGHLLLDNKPNSKRVFSEECAKIMQQLLSGVVERGTASSISLKKIVDTAGKTGTSGGSKDKLFVGFTPYYTAGIWTGYDNGGTAVSGSKHLNIWNDIMTEIHEEILSKLENPDVFKTDSLIYSAYCRDSGELFSPECILDPRADRVGYGYYIPGTEPRHNCTLHKIVRIDESSSEILRYYDYRYPFGKDIALLNLKSRNLPEGLIVADEKYILPEEYKSYWFSRKIRV